MFDDTRPGNGAFLSDVADDEDGDLVLLGELHDTPDALAQLGDRTRRRRDVVARHCLNRVDDENLYFVLTRLVDDIVEGCVGEQLKFARIEAEPV